MQPAAQTSFPFDLSPCGPVVDALAQRATLAGIVEKVDHDLSTYGGTPDDGPDFPSEDE